MPTILSAGCETLDPYEPLLSPAMERAFSEAFADITELDDLSVMIKVETEQSWPENECIDTSSFQMATPPPTASCDLEINPQMKNIATFIDAADAKRARRSAIEKKSRQRRQDVLKRMREEVKQLEHVYAAMAVKKEDAERVGLIQWNGLRSMEELQQKYSKLALVAHALEEDQANLLKLAQEHERYHSTVRRLSEERRAENAFAIWDSGVPPSSSFKARFRPLSMAEGYAFVRDTYEEMQKFTECESYETTGASFMGWTDKRTYNPNTYVLQYGFTKRFPFEDAERVFTKSWNTFTDGEKLEHLAFDRSTQSRFEVLQVLNDDLLVVRRDYRTPRFPITLTSIQIMFRLQTPTGYAFCLRTVSSPEIQNALEPHEYMFDVFHWYGM
ncbi:hypothetical protein ON010_g1841 [Phytophthora cinnamomi]|nr:hypothetical protein ON010_g1841 [Phytophthora cinnamomi]